MIGVCIYHILRYSASTRTCSDSFDSYVCTVPRVVLIQRDSSLTEKLVIHNQTELSSRSSCNPILRTLEMETLRLAYPSLFCASSGTRHSLYYEFHSELTLFPAI